MASRRKFLTPDHGLAMGCIKWLLHHARCDARRCDALYAIDWVEGKSTGGFTPSASREVAEPFGHVSLPIWKLHHEGQHVFWQLASGSSRVSGICHQSFQCFRCLERATPREIACDVKAKASAREQVTRRLSSHMVLKEHSQSRAAQPQDKLPNYWKDGMVSGHKNWVWGLLSQYIGMTTDLAQSKGWNQTQPA